MSEECTAKNMLVKIADVVFNMRPLNYKQGASFEAPYIHLKPLTFIHSYFLLSVQAR